MILRPPVARARYVLPRDPEGPCSFPCGHSYCAAMFQYAATCCLLCNQPLGFDTEFLELYDGQMVHKHCPVPIEDTPAPSLWRRLMDKFRVGLP